MRWVKVAIITVIVLAIIPTIISVINKLSEIETEYVEYEITITEDNIDITVYELYDIIKLDESGNVTNWLYVEFNGVILNITRFRYDEPNNVIEIRAPIGEGITQIINLDLDNPVEYSYITGDFEYMKIALYDEIVIEPPLSSTELILISLIPLILVSGLLIYHYKELGLNIRKE